MKNEIVIEMIVPYCGDYLNLEWEDDYHIATRIENGNTIILKADKEGLISLARHLLTLAYHPIESHIHFDDFNETLEKGSNELVLVRKDVWS